MKTIFKRQRLFSERVLEKNYIGYARALNCELEYLNQQIVWLNKIGCKLIFSEAISLGSDEKPQLQKAMNSLKKGDSFVLTKLDRAFNSKSEFIKVVNNLFRKGINVRTFSTFFCANNSPYGIINLFVCIVISLIRYEKTGGWIMSAAKKDVEDNLEDNYFVFTGDCIATLTLVIGVGCLFY